jgi:hypothetical protein
MLKKCRVVERDCTIPCSPLGNHPLTIQASFQLRPCRRRALVLIRSYKPLMPEGQLACVVARMNCCLLPQRLIPASLDKTA